MIGLEGVNTRDAGVPVTECPVNDAAAARQLRSRIARSTMLPLRDSSGHGVPGQRCCRCATVPVTECPVNDVAALVK